MKKHQAHYMAYQSYIAEQYMLGRMTWAEYLRAGGRLVRR